MIKPEAAAAQAGQTEQQPAPTSPMQYDAEITHNRAGQHPTGEADSRTTAEMADEIWRHMGPAILREHLERPEIGGV